MMGGCLLLDYEGKSSAESGNSKFQSQVVFIRRSKHSRNGQKVSVAQVKGVWSVTGSEKPSKATTQETLKVRGCTPSETRSH